MQCFGEAHQRLRCPGPQAGDAAQTPNMLLFLGQGFEDLEATAVIDVCGWTEYREHLPTVRVTTKTGHGQTGNWQKGEHPLWGVFPHEQPSYCFRITVTSLLDGGAHSPSA